MPRDTPKTFSNQLRNLNQGIIMRKIGFFTSLAFMIGLGTAFGQGTSDYIKFKPGATPNDGELQIAVETWKTPDGRIVV